MMIMNLYRAVDREKLQFDFIVYHKLSEEVENEIKRLGGRVFSIRRAKESGVLRFVGSIEKIIRLNGPYTAIHAHIEHQAGLAAAAAKRAGVTRRLSHGHSDSRGSRRLALKKIAGRVLISLFVTQRCACSSSAGEALYGRRAVKKNLVRLVNNGIDLTGYAYREAGHREALLKECGVTGDPVVIGNVGRMIR
jgi:glycosyltransferase EpsF